MEVKPNGTIALIGGATQEFVVSPAALTGWSLERGHGTITDDGNETAVYSSPNRTGADTLRVVNIAGGQQVNVEIEVLGLFPLMPSYGTASAAAKDSRVNALQGGGRVAAPGSGAYLRFALSGSNATAEEISALADFHAWHHPALSFYVMDYRLKRTIPCKFDGDAEWKQISFDSFDWSVPLRTFSFSAGFGGDLNSPFGA
jgi:hypothetical protein